MTREANATLPPSVSASVQLGMGLDPLPDSLPEANGCTAHTHDGELHDSQEGNLPLPGIQEPASGGQKQEPMTAGTNDTRDSELVSRVAPSAAAQWQQLRWNRTLFALRNNGVKSGNQSYTG